MPKTIVQTVKFKGIKARTLYNHYMSPKKHAAITGGAKVTISKRPGTSFSAFGGKIKGKTIHLIPNRMIVQTWKAWPKGDESIITFTFEDGKGGAKINMIHANIPNAAHAGIKTGWNEHYWKPWRKMVK